MWATQEEAEKKRTEMVSDLDIRKLFREGEPEVK